MEAVFSVGWRTDRLREVIHATPRQTWSAAIDTHGEPVGSATRPNGAHTCVEDRIRITVRHEAPKDRVEVRDLRRSAVAAAG